MRRLLPTIIAILLALAVAGPVGLSASSAHAQRAEAGAHRAPTGGELAAARRLFGEAKRHEKDGQWQQALDKFEKVAQVKMTPQVRFHVALCQEHLGRWVEAINGYELSAQEAEAARPRASNVADNAPPRARALRARVAHLRLRITGQVHASRVTIDGRQVSMALLDTALPVDPGEHTVEVHGGGQVTHREQIELAEGESGEIELEIHDPEPAPTATASAASAHPRPPPVPSGSVEPPPSRLPAYLLGGAGLLALGGAAVTFGLRQATISNVRCDDPEGFTGCDPRDSETVDLARTYDLTSKIALGVGAAALATGVVLWFVLAPPDDPAPAKGSTRHRARRRAAAVGLAPAAGGVGLVGRF